ncbi:MAG: recombinase family protein [Chlorobiaceae bacterium]
MKARLIGYARTSTPDQNLDMQIEALKKAGCKKQYIYFDKPRTPKSGTPQLEQCIEELREGDTLVVWGLVHPEKTVHHLIQLVTKLQKRGIGFRSISDEAMESASDADRLVLKMLNTLAKIEHRLREATADKRKGGRKAIEGDDLKVQMVKKMSQNTSVSVKEICQSLKISRSTYYRYLAMKR